MKTIVLASASPRRKELLERIGLAFKVDRTDIVERLDEDVEPHELARRLSLSKAEMAARRYSSAIIIAADTIGVLEGHLIGKPATEAKARDMLKSLSGKCHRVITGFAIIDTDTGKTVSRSTETAVYFRELSDAEIDAYIRSDEPMDKAGAYAIQGLGSLLVRKIEGDYFNVMGLPLSDLAETLKEFGVDVLLNAATRPQSD
jgi:septum formation protein